MKKYYMDQSLLGRLEAILFVASKPLTMTQLAKALAVDDVLVSDTIDTLVMKYNREESGIHVMTSDNTVQMVTNPIFSDTTENFTKQEILGELTKAQLETLTVVAYRGPVTRPEIEQIRGVNCSVILRTLLVRGLIQEQKREDTIMPAFQLSITALRHLGIDSPEQLPEYDTLHRHEYIDHVLASE